MKSAIHNEIQSQIINICKDLGFDAIPEYRGKDWRADVLVLKDGRKFAFEIQISPQSLKKTLERQSKYIRDGIIGCWFFEKIPSKLTDERPDLPLFLINKQAGDNAFFVSLGERRQLSLSEFLRQFLSNGVKFCEVARAKREQRVKLVFYEMKCWKCGAMNHIYYVDTSFVSACEAKIRPDESMWASNKMEYRPEIVKLAREFVNSEKGSFLNLGNIKQRYSKTVQESYMSFGCYKCDSIFGDWYVMEAQVEAMYGYRQVAIVERVISLHDHIEIPAPHWCAPGDNLPFCDGSYREEI